MILWRSGGKGWLTELINESMNDEAVYRTAPAIPGLLIIVQQYIPTPWIEWGYKWMILQAALLTPLGSLGHIYSQFCQTFALKCEENTYISEIYFFNYNKKSIFWKVQRVEVSSGHGINSWWEWVGFTESVEKSWKHENSEKTTSYFSEFW